MFAGIGIGIGYS